MSGSVTDAPGISRFDRGVACRNVRLGPRGQWHPCPERAPSKVGRIRAPDRDARTRCQCAPLPGGVPSATRATLRPCPDPAALGLLVLAVAFALAPAAAAPRRRRSIRPALTADGRPPGAYPDLEALVPASYQGAPPETLDSGRNCRSTNLGSLASKGITEVRFAGGTWTFGAERAAVLAVFRTTGLTADALADVLHGQRQGRGQDARSPGTSEPMIAGRPGYRLDTKTGERVQTVVVWPAAASRRRQRGHHQRPAGRPDPGRHRRVRRTADVPVRRPPRAVRVVGRRAVPALMLVGHRGAGQQGATDPDRRPRPATRGGAAMRGAADVAGGRYRPSTGTPAWPRRRRLAMRGRVAVRRAGRPEPAAR